MAFYSKIIGTGSGFPERVVTNADLEKIVDTTDEWIRTRTGIESRRIAQPEKGESTLTFCEIAARQAMQAAGVTGADIDIILVGTVTPDTLMPNTANQLQAAIGAHGAFSFDLQAACSGWVFGLATADAFLRSGQKRTALVIGAETLSSIVNWQDRSTCVLFGDGAGAAILQRTEDPAHSILATKIYSDGRYGHILSIPHGFCKVPPYSAEYRHDMHKIKMNGSEIFKFAVRNMCESSKTILEENGFAVKDVDHFIFHQANLRIIDMCLKTLEVPPEKTSINLQKYGNTSAATLPVCLDEALRGGKVRSGDLVLMTTFGGGITWGSALVRI
ncbi:ketoacyl-ACP synthase III [bacterium]|nr:ketoacyl-ACP synthase III [bacterium]